MGVESSAGSELIRKRRSRRCEYSPNLFCMLNGNLYLAMKRDGSPVARQRGGCQDFCHVTYIFRFLYFFHFPKTKTTTLSRMAPSAEAESVAIWYFWDFSLGIFQFLHNNFLRQWSQVLEIGSLERGDQGDVDRIQVCPVCSMGTYT